MLYEIQVSLGIILHVRVAPVKLKNSKTQKLKNSKTQKLKLGDDH
jgi:hypothetical protein